MKTTTKDLVLAMIIASCLFIGCTVSSSDDTANSAAIVGDNSMNANSGDQQQPERFGNPDHVYVIEENASSGTIIGQVPGMDQGAQSYSIEGNTSPFEVNNQGYLKNTSQPTRSERANYNLKIRVNKSTEEEVIKVTIFVIPSGNLASHKGIRKDHWSNIGAIWIGELVESSKYPDMPEISEVVNELQTDSNSEGYKEYYGDRYSGYLIPQISSEYQFAVSGNKQVRLSWAETALEKDLKRIAYMEEMYESTLPGEYDKYESQQSKKLNLMQGKVYAIEALHKVWYAGYHLEIAWKQEGEAGFKILDSSVLYTPAVFDPQVPKPPFFSIDSVSNGTVKLLWRSGSGDNDIAHFILYRDDELIQTFDSNTLSYNDSGVPSGSSTYALVAKDEFGNVSEPTILTINTSNSYDAVAEAIRTGNSALLDGFDRILQAGIAESEASINRVSSVLEQIYGNDPINYVPGAESQFIIPKNKADAIPLLIGNKGNYLAAMQEIDNKRTGGFGYAVFHFIPKSQNSQFLEPLKNSLAWLIKRDPSDPNSFTQSANIAVTPWGDSDFNAVNNWFKENIPAWTVTKCFDYQDLSNCYQGKDLIIIKTITLGQNGNTDGPKDNELGDTIAAALNASQASGLFVQSWGFNHTNVSHKVLDALGFQPFPGYGNADIGDSAVYNNYTEMINQNGLSIKIKDLLTHLRDNDFNIDWSTCSSEENTKWNCSDVQSWKNQFLSTALEIKKQLNFIDAEGYNIFNSNQHKLLKILILIGDKFRENVFYSTPSPRDDLDKNSNTLAFARAYFSDLTVYYNREYTSTPQNLGTFSQLVSKDDVSMGSGAFKKTTRNYGRYHMTCMYAVPGEKFSVKRTDSNDVKTAIQINMLRDTTFLYTPASGWNHGYRRPTNLTSPKIDIRAAESLNIISPWGGPIFIYTEPTDTSQTIQVEIENATTYPCINDVNDQGQVAQFKEDYENTILNWIGIETELISVQSTMDRFNRTLTDKVFESNMDPVYYKDIDKLISHTWKYLTKQNYELAGFTANGLSLKAGAQAFCSAKGWDCTNAEIHSPPAQQFYNADYPLCGDGCSGNPVDFNWHYSPINWGESHELGHNIQAGFLDINGKMGEISNNMFPQYIRYKFNQEMRGNPYPMWNSDIETSKNIFDMLKTAQQQGDPISAAKAAVWDKSDYTYMFVAFMQMPWLAKQYGNTVYFNDGWEVYTIAYLQYRLFNRAKTDSDTWNSKKDSLGFSTYDTAPSSINGNDFALIIFSYIIARDMRPYFDMWGITYSNEASTQVQSFGFSPIEKVFIPVFDNEPKAPVAINSSAVWPYPSEE